MTINIQVTVFSHVFAHCFLLRHLNTPWLGYRTFLFANAIRNSISMQVQQISRITGFHTNHGPNRTNITNRLFILITDDKITVSKKTIHILHPCLNTETFMARRQIFQFNCQTRKHPCIMLSSLFNDIKASFGCIGIRTIQQVLTQYTHGKFTPNIQMKRKCFELVCSNLTITHGLPASVFYTFPRDNRGIHSHAQNYSWL